MSSRRLPDPTDLAAVRSYRAFWNALAVHAESQGLRKAPLFRRLEAAYDRNGRSKPSKAAFYARFAKGTRVDWDEVRLLISTIPQTDPAKWKPAWERADAQWHADLRRRKQQPDPDPVPPIATDAVPADDRGPSEAADLPAGAASAEFAGPSGAAPPDRLASVPGESATPSSRRPTLLLALAVATTVFAGVALLLTTAGWTAGTPDPPSASGVPGASSSLSSSSAVSARATPSSSSPRPSSPAARSPSAQPAARPVAELPAGPPNSSATAAKGKGHAEFHRDTATFVIYDDDDDGKSAVLQFTVDGVQYRPVYNSKGLTEGDNLPKPVVVDDLARDAVVVYRVCAAPYPNTPAATTCGAWTRDAAT